MTRRRMNRLVQLYLESLGRPELWPKVERVMNLSNEKMVDDIGNLIMRAADRGKVEVIVEKLLEYLSQSLYNLASWDTFVLRMYREVLDIDITDLDTA